MTLQPYLTARESEVQAFEDTPRAVIAKLMGISPKTVQSYRQSIARKRGMPLSATEERVLHYCSCGYENKEIARAIFRSETTVKSHKANIRAKIGEAEFRRRVFRNA